MAKYIVIIDPHLRDFYCIKTEINQLPKKSNIDRNINVEQMYKKF